MALILYSGQSGGFLPPLDPISVSTHPGWMAKHVKPWGSSSVAKSFSDMLLAALEILQMAACPDPVFSMEPIIDEIFMIILDRFSPYINCKSFWVRQTLPITLVYSTLAISLVSQLSMEFTGSIGVPENAEMPALLIKMSILTFCDLRFSASSSTDFVSSISHQKTRLWPLSPTSWFNSSALAGFLHVASTFTPCTATNYLTNSRPRPLEHPVIKMVLLSNEKV